MKFSFKDTPLPNAGRTYTRFIFSEKDEARAVTQKDGSMALSVGIGKPRAEMNRRRLTLLVRKVIHTAKEAGVRKVAFAAETPLVDSAMEAPAAHDAGVLLAESAAMAAYEYRAYKTKPKEGWKDVEEILVCGAVPRAFRDGVRRGRIIAEEVNACRTLSNTPGGEMTPRLLALAATRAARGRNVSVKVLDERALKKMGAGAILGVAAGSTERPKLIVLEYRGSAGKKRGEKAPIVFVGKGVTYDSGGLSLKPSDGMLDMHMDMSGAAAVLHAVVLAARLGVASDIIGIIPAVENMPSGASYRPGDILRSLSGKTIEVLNTDAEGRIILADGLTYALRYAPRLIIDVATLTGAALVALGEEASALMANDAALEASLVRLGEASGDYLWPFPLWEEYEGMTKGNFGDVANIPTANSRYAGVIGGGMFLYQFVKDAKVPWAHIDMAPKMTAAPNEYLAKGAAGAPVRLLLSVAESL